MTAAPPPGDAPPPETERLSATFADDASSAAAALAEDYLACLRRGERPDPAEYLRRRPDLAPRLLAERLEGPLLPADAGRESVASTEPLDRELVREIWEGTRTLIEQHLAAVTLEDLCQRKRQRSGEVMYYI